jgi:hypothetical protein
MDLGEGSLWHGDRMFGQCRIFTTPQLVALVCWGIWKELNARVFDHRSSLAHVLPDRIAQEERIWSLAGFSSLSDFFQ